MLLLPDTPESHSLAAREVSRGGVVAYRTDTFYGLGVDPFNREALKALNDLKGRGGKPILVVVADAESAGLFVRGANELFRALTRAFWPGPLTVVAEARAEVPEELTAGTRTVGVRLPDDEGVRRFVRACGGSLTATSANPAGAAPAASAADVERYFGSSPIVVIDGGEAVGVRPSTVVDATGPRVRLIREGMIKREALAAALAPFGAQLE